MNENVSAAEVRAQAEQFMELLASLRVDGTPEATRMRQALVEIVEQFRDTPDKERAKAELVMRLMGVEAGAADMLSRTVRSLRERLFKEMKRIGKHSKAGKAIHGMHDALGTLDDALQQLADASAERNSDLRQSAHALLAEAKAKLKAIGMQ